MSPTKLNNSSALLNNLFLSRTYSLRIQQVIVFYINKSLLYSLWVCEMQYLLQRPLSIYSRLLQPSRLKHILTLIVGKAIKPLVSAGCMQRDISSIRPLDLMAVISDLYTSESHTPCHVSHHKQWDLIFFLSNSHTLCGCVFWLSLT